MTLPLGACIERDQVHPGRTSNQPEIVVKPHGPHQRTKCSGSLHISKTSRRGASKIRVMTSPGSAERVASAAMVFFPFPTLQFFEVFLEASKAVVPKTTIVLEPLGGVL